MRKQFLFCFVLLCLTIITNCLAHGKDALSPPEEPIPAEKAILKLEDDLHRDTPRSSITHFLELLAVEDFKTASNYLDFRNLPSKIKKIPEEELTKQLEIILDRAVWVDITSLSDKVTGYSDDNLPGYRDFLGRVKLSNDTSIDLLLQKVPGEKGFQIWKISNRTVAQIPAMYSVHGYNEFEQKFVDIFPEYDLLGWEIWQWIFSLLIILALFIALSIPLWCISYYIKKQNTTFSLHLASFVTGPLRLAALLYLSDYVVFQFVTPSTAIRHIAQLHTLKLLAVLWVIFSIIELGKDRTAQILEKQGLQNSSILLRPARTMLRLVMLVIVVLVWLDNLGLSITTVLTGLGVGGIAFALAAQDTLKNLIGSVIIMLDRPYTVGQRVIVAGHDGEVEEIGLRSTKLRLLTGNQSIIPNEVMAKSAIENVSRRPHIRHKSNIALPYDTPLLKVKKAVEIIRTLLGDHEGMDTKKPAQVYFSSFKRDHLSIVMCYWYHPADYWTYMAFSQKVNEQIMERFEEEGISFALPTNRTFLEQ